MRASNRSTRSMSRAVSPAALIVAVLALVVAAAGAGYSAAKIGTKDIADNAVTSPKIKNGTVSNADLVKEKKFVKISAPGAPNFSNGGEGDCLWQDGSALIPGLAKASVLLDRFGRVHLAGVAVESDAPGGDAACDSSAVGETEDGIIMVLPKPLRPERTQIAMTGLGSGQVIVVGNQPLVSGSTFLPAGSVFASSGGALLDGISYFPVGSKVSARVTSPKQTTSEGRALLRQLGLR